ncbi:MAG: ATP-binding protein [Siphonobacter sp.]
MTLKKIVIVGPESTGKTTLTQRLAAHFDTVWVEEYGRIYCERFGNDCDALDLCHIAAGQLYLEEEGSKIARHNLLFCDTDLLVTQTYAEMYLGESPEVISHLAQEQHYDLYLLLDIDVPWINDSIRLFADRRQWHFDRLKTLLQERPYQIISGRFEERFERAKHCVEQLISSPEK